MSLWGMKSTPQNRPDRPPKVVGPVPPDQSDAPQKDPPSPCDGPNDLRQDDPGRSSVAKHGTHPVSGTTIQKSSVNQSFKPRSRADRRTTVSHTPAPEPSSSCSDGSVSYALNCRRPIIGLSNRHRGDSGPAQDTGRKPSRNRAFQRYIHDHMCRRQRHHPILLLLSNHLS